nr:Tn3 family transposase [Streptomyces kasugaensis]
MLPWVRTRANTPWSPPSIASSARPPTAPRKPDHPSGLPHPLIAPLARIWVTRPRPSWPYVSGQRTGANPRHNLFGLGTNMRIKRVAVTGEHGESEAMPRRVRHLLVNRANMRAAVRKLVNATFAVRDEMWWGTAPRAPPTAASSAPGPPALMTEWHQRRRPAEPAQH